MMTSSNGNGASPLRLEGKYKAIFICFILELGPLSRGTSYHPSRVPVLVCQSFAIVTVTLLAYNESKINTRKRILAGYILFTASNLFLLVLDLASSGKGGIGPCIGICAIVSLNGISTALVQGGAIGDLSLMCPEFVQSYLAGLGAAGALTSALRLITKATFEKASDGLRKGAMLFFAISTFLEFVCVLLYAFYFLKLPIVKFYHAKAAVEGSKTVSADLATAEIETSGQDETDPRHLERLSNKELFFQNIDYAVDLLLVHVITLAIFPGFLYENIGKHKLGEWYPLVLITMYNVWELIGRYIPLIEFLNLESRRGMMIANLSSFLLIPAFYFTAKYADQGWMIMLVSLLGLTYGYLTVCVLTAVPKGYRGPEQNALGNLLVAFMLGGILAGVALGWLWLIGGNNSF